MSRKFILSLSILLVVLFSPTWAAERIYRIGFSQATTTEPWRILFNQELRAEAAKYPEIILEVKDGNDSVEKQNRDMEEFIKNKMDAILISPKVSAGLTAVVDKAIAAGIPVFVLDRDVASKRYTQFIGGDNRAIGRAAGEHAVKLLGGLGKAQGNIVEIWGGMESTPARDRHEGFLEIVSKEAGLKIINSPRDGDWKQHLGYEIMANVIDSSKKIDLVYAHNDPMAYGAYLAAKDAGKEKGIFFLGIDGIPAEGVKWVYDGQLSATFLYKTPGDEGIRQALRHLKGDKVEHNLVLSTAVIDREAAAKILSQHGLLK